MNSEVTFLCKVLYYHSSADKDPVGCAMSSGK